MATGTGKTRTAAAFVKRLFEAGIVTRVLFLVDRIALGGQAEDAFNDHLRDYPCHVLRPGRGFDWTKRITIATLQTMITEYRDLSSGYFDLVITDECHRSIYGKWSGVLRHFDGIQLGLTATPCTAEADMLTKRHAETLAAMLDEHFADLKPRPATRYADFVVSDVGGGPAPDASAIIKRFKEEEFPKILVSVNMLDTGFDCPEVVSLVMARFTRSAILYRQMRGRGTRKAPHIGKIDFTIFDFVGVTDFHGDDDGDIGGGEARGPKPPGPGEPHMLLTLDVDDQIDPATLKLFTPERKSKENPYLLA